MDFKLTEEQQMLQDTAARLVRDAYPFEQREKFSESELGFSAEFWGQLGELGLTAVPFAEEIGGFGGGGVETMLVMTELGRGLTPAHPMERLRVEEEPIQIKQAGHRWMRHPWRESSVSLVKRVNGIRRINKRLQERWICSLP